MGDEEEAPTLETQLAAIAASYGGQAAPITKDRAIAAADLAALGPLFEAELTTIKAEPEGSAKGMAAATLQAKTSCARDFHLQRIAECDAKLGRVATRQALDEADARAKAAPPPEEE